jgi:aryl-alcohol dehydrogenase-like predicted oxidoreductase
MTDAVAFPGCATETAPLGIGTWAWGDKATWGMGGYDTDLTEATIEAAWNTSIAAGVTLIDTAEVYGDGESERIIGRLLADDPGLRDSLVIATKFLPMPWKLNVVDSLRRAVVASIERLGVDTIDLYQIHGPVSLRSAKTMAEALAKVHADGLIRAVGVSNYSVTEMRKIHHELSVHGIPLASNQIEFSLLRRRPDTTGLLGACRELGVVPLAYSPIGQGRLTGKYSAASPPPGSRTFSAHPMEKIDPIVAELRRIGERHDNRTPSQVALRWIIEKGAVPIPGAKNGDQAAQNAGALGWSLDDDDMRSLDDVCLEGQRTIKQRMWQHG